MGMHTSGKVSKDTLHIKGLKISDQQFEEATYLHPVPGYWDFAFDGALGLAPPETGGIPNKLHPFSMIIEQSILDGNILALMLPCSTDAVGELAFGGIDENMFTGDLIGIPITKETDPYLAGK